MKTRLAKCTIILGISILLAASNAWGQSLWEQAKANKDTLRISTLLTAQDVRDRLSSDAGIDKAIEWCRQTGVTRVFMESFRDGYTAERPAIEHAASRFREAGIEVSGCVTPTNVGKKSTGWAPISCYTDEGTQKRVQEIFEYAASLSDEIMIDDFWFTDCECPECQKARGDRSWAQYRCDLMTRVSRERILQPARAVNPNVKIIIKYPQWYDQFHNRGYDVVRETADFDRIWVGTETRDYEDKQWGGKVQYEAYFIMRWLGGIGGPKCGGGWFDPYGTHEATYVEQARQTVLADAKEMMLFCYGSLLEGTGPANVEKLRTEIPSLFKLAAIVRNQPLRGIAAPKPAGSDGGNEQYVYDFAGMLGLPLVPAAEICTDAKAAFLPIHAMKDPQWTDKLAALLKAGTPVLVTDGLAARLPSELASDKNLLTLKVDGKPKSLLSMTREDLKPIRDRLLAPLGLSFDAPNKVALYLIGDDAIAIENFNNEPITATLQFAEPINATNSLILPTDGQADFTCTAGKIEFTKITPRTLVVLSVADGAGATNTAISRTELAPGGSYAYYVDINSGDVKGSTISETPLSKEVRRLAIAVPAERKWMLMSSRNRRMSGDGVYRFVPEIGAELVSLLNRMNTADEERKAILERFMTSLRAEDPLQAKMKSYSLIQEIADTHN